MEDSIEKKIEKAADQFISRLPLFVVVGILGFGFCMGFMINYMNNTSQDPSIKEESYFSSSDYKIIGTISSRKHLGGCTYLLKINVDSASFASTVEPECLNFVGLYNERLNFAYFLAENCDWRHDEGSNWTSCRDSDWIDCGKVQRPLSPVNITIDSSQRKVFLETNNAVHEEVYRTSGIYSDHLVNYIKSLRNAVYANPDYYNLIKF